jgi:hypothetical protein
MIDALVEKRVEDRFWGFIHEFLAIENLCHGVDLRWAQGSGVRC